MKNIFRNRSIFYRAKLLTATDTTRLANLMKRGAPIGWNSVMLQEAGCLRDFTPDTACMSNLTAIKSLADSLKMDLIPCSFSQGEPVKTATVDLREAFPVKKTPFQVGAGVAKAAGGAILKNGSFDSLTSWSVDLPGTMISIDTAVKRSGVSSLRVQNPSLNAANGYKARIFQLVPTIPFRAYRLSVWIKTDQFSAPGNIGFLVIGAVNGRYLYQNRDYRLGAASPSVTQDWKQYVVDFNSLENTSCNVYFTCNGNASGRVWFDDAACVEVGLYSAVRRPGLNIVVTSQDETSTFVEGRDYTVGSEQLAIPAGSTIPASAALKVSWWQLADTYELWNIPASAAHPEFYTTLEANARLIYSRLNPLYWMMGFDEWRVGAWDRQPLLAGGVYLADVIRKSADILKRINPNITPLVWGDMFDGGHNAVKQYYGFNGDLTGSWLGMPANMVAVNWYSNPADPLASLQHWSDLGLRQWIGGYYESKDNVKRWLSNLDQAEVLTATRPKGVEKVEGFVYTTWGTGLDGGVGKYEDLEGVMDLLKASGRVSDLPPVEPDPDPPPIDPPPVDPPPIDPPPVLIPFGLTDAEMLAKGWVRK